MVPTTLLRLPRVLSPTANGDRTRGFCTALATIFLVLQGGIVALAADWELANDEEGIRVWTRVEEGKPIRAYRTEAVIEAPIVRVVELLLDFDGYAAWAGQVSESQTITRINPNEVIGYIRSDLPFPVADRDAVQHAIVKRGSDGSVRIELKSTPDRIPPYPSIVRMQDVDAVLDLEPLTGGKTQIRQHGYSDPGGAVPSFIINLFIVDGPRQMIQDLRRAATGVP